jgi:CheY-like chemotaxis protein
MLVEDNGADARLTSEILKETGAAHELVWFKEAGQALGSIRSEGHIDLFIIDLNLPRGSGLEVVAALRKIDGYRDTPVIIMTGSLVPGVNHGSAGQEPLHYIIKPMTIDEIDRTVLELQGIMQGIGN